MDVGIIARGFFSTVGGGFWAFLGLVAILGASSRSLKPRDRKMLYGFLLALALIAVPVAMFSGAGRTTPVNSHDVTRPNSKQPIEDLVSSSGIAFAAARQSEGWLYVGDLGASPRTIVPDGAYAEVLQHAPGLFPEPRRSDRVRLLRPSYLYTRPPQFSVVQLQWNLGVKSTDTPLPKGTVLQVTGNCSVILNSRVWCPVRQL